MQNHKAFPKITKVAEIMARCNGAINRKEPVEVFLAKLDEVLGAEGVDLADLVKIEAWVSSLDDEKLEILADGEYDDMQALLLGAPDFAGELFEDIFEVM